MTEKEFLGVISVIFGGIGYGGYIASIFKGKNKPHMFSWIIWVVVAGVVLAAQYSKNAGIGAWATVFQLCASITVAVLAVFLGEKNITRSDKIAFIGALGAIPLWCLTKEPLWSVIWVVIINVFAFYPTFRKSFFRPHQESMTVYIWDTASFAVALVVMQNYALASILYPVALMAMNTIFIAMLFYRRTALKNP